ncbi:hypothetical protein FNV43_RR10017 [Rhamnella rubrinervis]|uniref:Uncharacterized protein n=1 Tax=Rhamnella rubrinervis TaxID=2594499 RepID=A0A8K0HBT5_9ROSA|nr:hypothetical protein FNV43_RR10017 [Rhamnella rubrinervis]
MDHIGLAITKLLAVLVLLVATPGIIGSKSREMMRFMKPIGETEYRSSIIHAAPVQPAPPCLAALASTANSQISPLEFVLLFPSPATACLVPLPDLRGV